MAEGQELQCGLPSQSSGLQVLKVSLPPPPSIFKALINLSVENLFACVALLESSIERGRLKTKSMFSKRFGFSGSLWFSSKPSHWAPQAYVSVCFSDHPYKAFLSSPAWSEQANRKQTTASTCTSRMWFFTSACPSFVQDENLFFLLFPWWWKRSYLCDAVMNRIYKGLGWRVTLTQPSISRKRHWEIIDTSDFRTKEKWKPSIKEKNVTFVRFKMTF